MADDEQAMWLDVVEDDELPGATQLRVVVNEVSRGKGKGKRPRFMCSVTMHDAQRRKIDGYKRCQTIRPSDPRGSEDERQSVRQLSMAKFRAQKRERDADNLWDSPSDDDEADAGACHSPCLLLLVQTLVQALHVHALSLRFVFCCC